MLSYYQEVYLYRSTHKSDPVFHLPFLTLVIILSKTAKKLRCNSWLFWIFKRYSQNSQSPMSFTCSKFDDIRKTKGTKSGYGHVLLEKQPLIPKMSWQVDPNQTQIPNQSQIESQNEFFWGLPNSKFQIPNPKSQIPNVLLAFGDTFSDRRVLGYAKTRNPLGDNIMNDIQSG